MTLNGDYNRTVYNYNTDDTGNDYGHNPIAYFSNSVVFGQRVWSTLVMIDRTATSFSRLLPGGSIIYDLAGFIQSEFNDRVNALRESTWKDVAIQVGIFCAAFIFGLGFTALGCYFFGYPKNVFEYVLFGTSLLSSTVLTYIVLNLGLKCLKSLAARIASRGYVINGPNRVPPPQNLRQNRQIMGEIQ
jgi:hypothetical protein